MIKQTPLYVEHIGAGAVLVDFAGWKMPLHYGSQLQEHIHVRQAAGMFDVSHMGIIDVSGAQSQDFLSMLLANDIHKLNKPGKALYSCMLNAEGGIIDDLIVYFLQPNSYRLVVNASTTHKDLLWISLHAQEFAVQVTHRTDLAIIAVQGPEAIEKICAIADAEIVLQLKSLNKFTCVMQRDWLFARTGYTGEDGMEIILPSTAAKIFWQQLLKQGVKPIGLGVRDTLRLEAGLNLYGNDMDEAVTPLESNLAWTVSFEPASRAFIGRDKLQQQKKSGLSTQLIGMALNDKSILRHGQAIYCAGLQAGVVTSGSFAPTLGHSIGLARVALPLNNDYCVEIRGKMHPVRLITPPFVKRGKANF